MNNLESTILTRVHPQTCFPLFESTEVGEGFGVWCRGRIQKPVFLICKKFSRWWIVVHNKIYLFHVHINCWNHVDVVCFMKSQLCNDSSWHQDLLFLYEWDDLPCKCVSSLWNGKALYQTVASRLGEMQTNSNISGTQPTHRFGNETKFIKIMSWSHWVTWQFFHTVANLSRYLNHACVFASRWYCKVWFISGVKTKSRVSFIITVLA